MKIHNKQYVIPAEAGIQQVIENCIPNKPLDSRFRGNDAYVGQQWTKPTLQNLSPLSLRERVGVRGFEKLKP